ncbi:MAG TPA: S53 family peptidase [Acidimicrobiales bacterium]
MQRTRVDGTHTGGRRVTRRQRRIGLVSAVALAVSLMSAATLSTAASTAAQPSLSSTLAALTAPAAKLLDNTIPAVVDDATRLGAVDPGTPLTVVLPLQLAHQSQLDSYVQSEYTPGSASYHRFLSADGFANLFGASTSRLNAVSSILHGLGFSVVAPAANHLYVEATGTVGLIERTFDTVIDTLRLPATLSALGTTIDGTVNSLFTANITNLTLPATLANLVTGVEGLDSLNVPHPNIALPTAAATTLDHTVPLLPEHGVDGGSSPCAAAIAGVGYTAPQLANAYNFNGLYQQGLLGQGMTASLVEFTDYHDINLATLQRCYASTTNVQRVVVDGGGGSQPGGAEDEAMSDLTVLLELLPKLSNLDVYVAPNTATSEFDLYNAFVTNDDSPVLSASWGSCEETESQSGAHLLDEIAEEAAAQGQQIFAASGDSGAVDCRPLPPPTGDSISVETEAASPFITGVGGTDLGVRTTLGLGHDEETWNDAGAGGGGQSTYWTMPAWQAADPSTRTAPGVTGSACGAPAGTLCREIPDLSADADPDFGMQSDTQFQLKGDIGSPGYSIYCGTSNCDLTSELGLPVAIPYLPPDGLGGWQPIAGTSLATPLIASAALLWDQSAQAKGLGGLGFLNPALYRVAANPTEYAHDFFDITTDSNDAQYSSQCPPGCNENRLYDAAPGYDLATGLGSINAANLGADLVGQAAAITLTPNTVTLYGYTGGPSRTEPVTVSSGAAGNYNAISNASWLHVSGGAFGHPLSWSANPAGLKAGNYTGTILAAINGSYATMTVNYVVTPPATLAVSPGSVHLSEQAVTTKGAPTGPTCNSTLWADELTSAVGGVTPSAAQLASTLGSVKITNNGPAGSQLHWMAFLDNDTSGWLSEDLSPAGASAAQVATQPLVNTAGTLAAGQSATVSLASIANVNAVDSLPDLLNQGTYHGEVIVADEANLSKVFFVPVTLTLGDGKGTPTAVSTPPAVNLTVPSGQSASTSVVLSDSSKACGYAYSVASNVPWASVPQGGAIGNVGGLGGTASVPITVDASGLSPGIYHGTLTEQSVNAEPNPLTIPITLTVT